MKKIELEIVALSHSITQTHSYAVVLGEMNGLRRLPIVIGGFEAQAIAVALEKMQPSRPLTHDPDGNGVELYWDRPKEQWPKDKDGNLQMMTERLDLNDLLELAG